MLLNALRSKKKIKKQEISKKKIKKQEVSKKKIKKQETELRSKRTKVIS